MKYKSQIIQLILSVILGPAGMLYASLSAFILAVALSVWAIYAIYIMSNADLFRPMFETILGTQSIDIQYLLNLNVNTATPLFVLDSLVWVVFGFLAIKATNEGVSFKMNSLSGIGIYNKETETLRDELKAVCSDCSSIINSNSQSCVKCNSQKPFDSESTLKLMFTDWCNRHSDMPFASGVFPAGMVFGLILLGIFRLHTDFDFSNLTRNLLTILYLIITILIVVRYTIILQSGGPYYVFSTVGLRRLFRSYIAGKRDEDFNIEEANDAISRLYHAMSGRKQAYGYGISRGKYLNDASNSIVKIVLIISVLWFGINLQDAYLLIGNYEIIPKSGLIFYVYLALWVAVLFLQFRGFSKLSDDEEVYDNTLNSWLEKTHEPPIVKDTITDS